MRAGGLPSWFNVSPSDFTGTARTIRFVPGCVRMGCVRKIRKLEYPDSQVVGTRALTTISPRLPAISWNVAPSRASADA